MSGLYAQERAPAVRGKVVDPAGAPIRAASIHVDSESKPTLTDEQGDFALPLHAGTHRIIIAKAGFKPSNLSIELPQYGLTLAPTVLEIAPVNTSVTVSEDTGYLTGETSTGTKTPTPLRDVPQSVRASLANK